MGSAAGRYSDCTVEIVLGHAAVLSHRPALIEAAKPWGQGDEALDLAYFFAKPARLPTVPCMVLLRGRPAGERRQPILGAVLVYAFAGWLGWLRLFLSSNRRGRRTVFAPAEARVEVAAIAAQKLMHRGARFVNIDFDLGPREPDLQGFSATWPRHLALTRLRLRPGPGFEWALHEGRKRFDLALHEDYDQTVATLGKRSRRNLRYYQRLCARELGACFEPDAALTREEFLGMNPACSYPVKEAVARWRFDSLTRFPNTFVAGLRNPEADDGAWLSLLGGRRNHGAVEIDWQMNRRGYERFSLTTAMRSFLIEHEGATGSTSLYAEGGTVHSMRDSFRFHTVYNLAARKPSVVLRLLNWYLQRFLPGKTVALALEKRWRVWNPSNALESPTSPQHPE